MTLTWVELLAGFGGAVLLVFAGGGLYLMIEELIDQGKKHFRALAGIRQIRTLIEGFVASKGDKRPYDVIGEILDVCTKVLLG